jgi:hypothetical protein
VRKHWRDGRNFKRLVGFAPNHKPKKKIIATVKRLWDKYIIRGCRLRLRGITVRITGGVLSGIMHVGRHEPPEGSQVDSYPIAGSSTLRFSTKVCYRRASTLVALYPMRIECNCDFKGVRILPQQCWSRLLPLNYPAASHQSSSATDQSHHP